MQPCAEGASFTCFDHLLLTICQFYHGDFSPTRHTETLWDPTSIIRHQRKSCAALRAFSKQRWLQHLPVIPLLCPLLLPALSQSPGQAFLAPHWTSSCNPHCHCQTIGCQHTGLAGRVLAAMGSRISSSCGIPVLPHVLSALLFLCSLPTLQ